MDSARIRLEETEAGWRELATDLSERLHVVMEKPVALLPAPPRRLWPLLALALAVVVAALIPAALRRLRPAPPVDVVAPVVLPPQVLRASTARPPQPPQKRHHPKKKLHKRH